MLRQFTLSCLLSSVFLVAGLVLYVASMMGAVYGTYYSWSFIYSDIKSESYSWIGWAILGFVLANYWVYGWMEVGFFIDYFRGRKTSFRLVQGILDGQHENSCALLLLTEVSPASVRASAKAQHWKTIVDNFFCSWVMILFTLFNVFPLLVGLILLCCMSYVVAFSTLLGHSSSQFRTISLVVLPILWIPSIASVVYYFYTKLIGRFNRPLMLAVVALKGARSNSGISYLRCYLYFKEDRKDAWEEGFHLENEALEIEAIVESSFNGHFLKIQETSQLLPQCCRSYAKQTPDKVVFLPIPEHDLERARNLASLVNRKASFQDFKAFQQIEQSQMETVALIL